MSEPQAQHILELIDQRSLEARRHAVYKLRAAKEITHLQNSRQGLKRALKVSFAKQVRWYPPQYRLPTEGVWVLDQDGDKCWHQIEGWFNLTGSVDAPEYWCEVPTR